MIHLSKSRCGYLEYTCTGIVQLPPFPQPSCDTTNYDIVSDSRSQDNNFLNLPRSFIGVVSSVNFIDLSSVAIKNPYDCIQEYDPLKGRLIDAFDKVASNSSYIANRGNQKQILDCYSNSLSQGPGILLPSANLSAFSPIPLLAVPTVALPSAQVSSVSARGAVTSGCKGLCVTAKATGSYTVTFSIRAGKAIVSVTDSGEPVQIDVPALQNQVANLQQSQTRGLLRSENNNSDEDKKKIQVYVIAGYDVQQGTWQAVVDWKSENHNFSPTTPDHYIKLKLLATIVYVDRSTVDVIQGQCSPIDLRDWVSQQGLPTADGDSDLYVFSYVGSSTKKGWIPVKDC